MDTGGGPHIHPRTLRHRDARAHGRRVPQTLGLHAAEADQGCLRAKAGSREEVACRGVPCDFRARKDGKSRDPLGGRDGGDEYGCTRAVVFASRNNADDPCGVGFAAEILNDFIGEQPGQVPLDDNRRRVQCRQANRVYGKPRKGRSAKGVLGHGQPESPSLQAGEGMAGEERGANRGVLSPELQSGAEPGRKAECRLETRYHHERSKTNEGWFAEENNRPHEHGESVARASKVLFPGQARSLCRRLTIIHCRSNNC